MDIIGTSHDTELSEQLRQRLAVQKRNVSTRFLSNSSNSGVRSAAHGPAEADQTLEIMMSDLDPEVMKIFTKQVSATAAEATRVGNPFKTLFFFYVSRDLLICLI